ncbi:short chain dehydrogenase [Gregarina niphandrodes]|uniref:Short chain dehydrogenase n=1 Tax=Gregarina niphandrodes TaxID=110365 RepID=A0A023B6B9_GRENI|nr:short chain dehydrogenase [Gregarina niphandrodes]EZG65917.1 short chain dehydrogenase [Gregarina niphandrodes]|eukprot:XP_011134029.1 short chain dehydrogenase [Gregarina niphandrodes]
MLLWWIGFLAPLKLLLKLVLGLLCRLRSHPVKLWTGTLSRALNNKESYIVVTGCTDGIGLATLRKIVEHYPQNPVLLVGRNKDKLSKVTESLGTTYENLPSKSEDRKSGTRRIEVAVVDFATENWPAEMERTLKGKSVGLLLNAAGETDVINRRYDEVDESLIIRLIQVNLRSAMLMSRLCLPSMTVQKAGVIVNIGSMNLVAEEPFQAIYTATKGGIRAFSEALQSEVRSKNILVQNWEPGLVNTKMTLGRYKGLDRFSCSADEFAEYAFCMLQNGTHELLIPFGYQPVTFSPYPLHEVTCGLAKFVPTHFLNQYAIHTRDSHTVEFIHCQTSRPNHGPHS